MERSDIKERILAWVDSVGRVEAVKALISEDISVDTANKLVSGRYPSEPRGLTQKAIEAAMGAIPGKVEAS